MTVIVTTENPPAAVGDISTATPVAPVQPRTSSTTATTPPVSVGVGRAYERFLELPVGVVVGLMWLAGAALIGSFALAVYLVVSALL